MSILEKTKLQLWITTCAWNEPLYLWTHCWKKTNSILSPADHREMIYDHQLCSPQHLRMASNQIGSPLACRDRWSLLRSLEKDGYPSASQPGWNSTTEAGATNGAFAKILDTNYESTLTQFGALICLSSNAILKEESGTSHKWLLFARTVEPVKFSG